MPSFWHDILRQQRHVSSEHTQYLLYTAAFHYSKFQWSRQVREQSFHGSGTIRDPRNHSVTRLCPSPVAVNTALNLVFTKLILMIAVEDQSIFRLVSAANRCECKSNARRGCNVRLLEVGFSSSACIALVRPIQQSQK